MNGLRKQSSECRASGSEALFSTCRGDHWPRAVTIESSLESRCASSHKSVQDGYNGTCVELEASKRKVGYI